MPPYPSSAAAYICVRLLFPQSASSPAPFPRNATHDCIWWHGALRLMSTLSVRLLRTPADDAVEAEMEPSAMSGLAPLAAAGREPSGRGTAGSRGRWAVRSPPWRSGADGKGMRLTACLRRAVKPPGEEVSTTEEEIKTRKRHKSDDQMDPVWARGLLIYGWP